MNNGQYGGDNSDVEIFAYLYVGWVNGFGDPLIGPLRQDFMNKHMNSIFSALFK